MINDIVVDSKRNVCWIATQSPCSLWRWCPSSLSPSSSSLTRISTKRRGFRDGVVRLSRFRQLSCLAIDSHDGTLWIYDAITNRFFAPCQMVPYAPFGTVTFTCLIRQRNSTLCILLLVIIQIFGPG